MISHDEVRRIAKLARLTVNDAEVDALSKDMSKILDYVRQLEALDTTHVAPTSHAVELPTKLRPDRKEEGLSVEAALQNAPERLGDGFGVPKIIE